MGDRSQADAFVKDKSDEDIASINAAFAAQAEHFHLHYDCRHCLHVNVDTNKCSQLYPNEHLWAAAPKRHALDANGDLVFCKYFESV